MFVSRERVLKGFEKLTASVSAVFNWVALAALSLMLVVVAADILGAKLLGRPFPGAMDLISLLLLIIIGFSTAETYAKGRHIKVTFVSFLLPSRLRKGVRLLSTSLCMILFLIMIWRLLLYARDLQVYGESSMTVNFPLAPFAYALGIAFIPVGMVVLVQLYKLVKGQGE